VLQAIKDELNKRPFEKLLQLLGRGPGTIEEEGRAVPNTGTTAPSPRGENRGAAEKPKPREQAGRSYRDPNLPDDLTFDSPEGAENWGRYLLKRAKWMKSHPDESGWGPAKIETNSKGQKYLNMPSMDRALVAEDLDKLSPGEKVRVYLAYYDPDVTTERYDEIFDPAMWERLKRQLK
jgi:hypothetical protein